MMPTCCFSFHILLYLVVAAVALDVNLPEWRREREKFSSLWLTPQVKKLDANYKKCCVDLGVPENLAIIACKYRDFEALEQQLDSAESGEAEEDREKTRGQAADREETLAKCNMVQYWPYSPQITYCLHDTIPLGECIEEFPNKDGEWYPETCSKAFGSGKADFLEDLSENAQKYIKCFDFTRQQVKCARDLMIAERLSEEKTHFKYQKDPNAPYAKDSNLDPCRLKANGENVSSKRKLMVKICQIEEKKMFKKFLKELEKSGRGDEEWTYKSFYNPDDCS